MPLFAKYEPRPVQQLADDMFELLKQPMENEMTRVCSFGNTILQAILDDHAAQGESPYPSFTVVCEHEGNTYDVTYSIVGNQIMMSTVDEHFEMDELTRQIFDMRVYGRPDQ